jgi:hypothetical protein
LFDRPAAKLSRPDGRSVAMPNDGDDDDDNNVDVAGKTAGHDAKIETPKKSFSFFCFKFYFILF